MDINALFNHKEFCQNIRGKVKFHADYPGISNLFNNNNNYNYHNNHSPCKLIFERISNTKTSITGDLEDEINNRFLYFVSSVLPRIEKSSNGKFLVMVTSQIDYIRLRNHFNKEGIDHIGIYEETPSADIAKLVQRFSEDQHSILLYSERFFYFNGSNVFNPKEFPQEINQVLFYSLPENPFVYQSCLKWLRMATTTTTTSTTKNISDNNKFDRGQNYLTIVNKKQKINNGEFKGDFKILSLFSKLDVLKIERILGTQKVQDLIHNSEKTTFIF